MQKGIISSFDKFAEANPSLNLDLTPQRALALKDYFSFGGFVSIISFDSGAWPKLVYPSKQRILHQLNELEASRKLFESKLNDWKQKHSEAKNYKTVNAIKKFSEPVYWKHLIKKMTDKEYSSSVDKVKLPVDLVSDKKYKPMIETFLKDAEYRRHLIEAFENSVVYKKDKELAKHATNLQEFRKDVSQTKIDELSKKVNSINKNISCLKEMAKWAET
ncbi:MAG: hypothetical protein COT90_00150 [Candidatus Diapherotrites archaeon CG10_big_fil_rev_8_21_14_0_10_31_34]|nr:MAG: hypothetical protein COT90_00150 [Candidatus Diapherotrites archaeon CG10_big_fil_rev_8_21_14_0_10_31_34]PJA18562.1 MAG: hypothetical protein COX63_02125 [Candidatus Diapherotrites archaeon CG_4_10_14_0_2_um_filter_31_5]